MCPDDFVDGVPLSGGLARGLSITLRKGGYSMTVAFFGISRKLACEYTLKYYLYKMWSKIFPSELSNARAKAYENKITAGDDLRKIPKDTLFKFTMNGEIPVMLKYRDDRISTTVNIAPEIYADVFSQLEQRTFNYYKKEVFSFYDALEDYDLYGKKVLIFGLTGCNCEAIALWKKAKEVYVVDYNKPICQHERITVLSMEEYCSGNLDIDFAFSFSSFEHDGLGRYGDPISPDADIAAMQRAKKAVKQGGILFLGVPIGRDCLVWNVHRIYGERRLPLLLRDWSCLDVYYYKKLDFFKKPLGAHLQPLLVLQNTTAGRDDILKRLEYADGLIKKNDKTMKDGKTLCKILKLQLADIERRTQKNLG
jgi:hypothetical protein